MITLCFGLPGSGKTTFAAKLAIDECVKIATGRSKYKHVFSNFGIKHPLIIEYKNDDIGKYDMSNSLILIDEATLFADSRDYKSFSSEKKSFFMLHRHYECDIVLFVQQWSAVDSKIRSITEQVYYLKRMGKNRTRIIRLKYGVVIPQFDPDGKADSSQLGDIVQGYSMPPLFVRVFMPCFDRRKYYKYFDTLEHPELPPFPNPLFKSDKASN